MHDFQAAAQRDPQNSLYHNNLGVAYLELERPGDALLELNDAVRLSPENPLPLIHRALANRRLKQLPEAVADLDAAIALDGSNAIAFANRAVAYAMQRDFWLPNKIWIAPLRSMAPFSKSTKAVRSSNYWRETTPWR